MRLGKSNIVEPTPGVYLDPIKSYKPKLYWPHNVIICPQMTFTEAHMHWCKVAPSYKQKRINNSRVEWGKTPMAGQTSTPFISRMFRFQEKSK